MGNRKKILCIGSITTDFIVSAVDQLPSPGILQAVDSFSVHVGGCAANAAMALGRLGFSAGLCGKVGQDMMGEFVCRRAKEEGVDVRGLVVDPSVATTASVVCVNSQGERSFLYYPGSTSSFFREDISDALLEEYDIIFVSGTMLLTGLDGEPCGRLLKKARSLGKYTVMDTAWDFEGRWLPKVLPALPYLNLFMPSREEGEQLTGEKEADAMADTLLQWGAENVVIKMGHKGAYVCPAGQKRKTVPAYSVQAVDTTGAGDSFCAGFLAGLAQGWDYYQSARLGNGVGAHCVMAQGACTGIRPLKDILNFIEENDPYVSYIK